MFPYENEVIHYSNETNQFVLKGQIKICKQYPHYNRISFPLRLKGCFTTAEPSGTFILLLNNNLEYISSFWHMISIPVIFFGITIECRSFRNAHLCIKPGNFRLFRRRETTFLVQDTVISRFWKASTNHPFQQQRFLNREKVLIPQA